VYIEVLGPLNVREQGISIVPSAGKPRQILALLVLRNGRAVSVSNLMEELWGDETPRSATTTLQTYILQLRRKIAKTLAHEQDRNAKDVLVTKYGGYQLNVGPGTFDLRTFERLAARGDAELEAGDALSASADLGEALALWRGSALQDVPAGPVLSMELLGLQEARMRALDLRITADLLLGRHAALIPELRMLTAQNPLHENLHAQLMLALHRSGSTWRALEMFQQLRGCLVTELGVEPSPRLQRLHQAILAGDPALDFAPAATAAGLHGQRTLLTVGPLR